MHFRLCCTCDDEEKVKTVENRENSAPNNDSPPNIVPPTTARVITQQPKNVVEQPIQLDRITEVSVEESSIQAMEEEQQTPIGQSIRPPQTPSPAPPPPPIQEPPIPALRKVETDKDISLSENNEDPQMPETHSAKINEFLNLLQVNRAKERYIAPVIQSPVNQTSNISVDTTIGTEKLTFSQIAPDLYRGIFKGSQFYIINGKLQDDYYSFDENDKLTIQAIYDKVMESMQRGIEGLSGGMSALNGQSQEIWDPSPGSTINTNYITRRGGKAVMTFKAIGKGHFRSTYEGKEFTILNGQLREVDSSFDEEDKRLIMQTYKNTLLGMEHGLQSMRQGMLGVKTTELQATQTNAIGGSAFAGTTFQNGSSVGSVAVGGNASAYGMRGGSAYASANGGVASAYAAVDETSASYNILATGRETLKRMRSLNHGKRISLLEGGLMAQPRQPVMVIEDITDEKPKNPRFSDEVDAGKLPEPVLQKTTFTPQAIIYDDPKTYEEQDNNELPLPKQLDEYIISVDENFNSENRYHFHKARPRRVTRGKLNPREKFRLASPERYSLFEGECLKLHNEYRKMHGVPPLVHNEFLAQIAKEWAEHLALKDAFYHRPKNEYGENLYYVEGMPCRAKMAVKAWYDEIDLYDYDNPKFSKEVGHFTQLIWKDTREVGTGVAQIGDKVWVCCNYHPPGNYLDKMNDEFVPRPVIKRFKRN